MASSGAHKRRKGLRGENEVRKEFVQAGFTVRGLDGSGDNLVSVPPYWLHIESKRQETLALPLWIRQAEGEAPQETIPVVVFRRSAEVWRADLRLADFLALLRR